MLGNHHPTGTQYNNATVRAGSSCPLFIADVRYIMLTLPLILSRYAVSLGDFKGGGELCVEIAPDTVAVVRNASSLPTGVTCDGSGDTLLAWRLSQHAVLLPAFESLL